MQDVRTSREGYFGAYGGRFVPETLSFALDELTAAYDAARVDPAFEERLDDLLTHYVGRSTPLYFAERLTRHGGGASIYLKREDLNHTGAHKINNAIGQALLFGKSLIENNEHEGYRKVIDLSADSANSWNGIPLSTARDQVAEAGITINGLAVLCRACSGRPVGYDLEQAFENTIIGGPDAFVITADDMQQFSTAVKRKLTLEIAAGLQRLDLAYD